MFWVLLVLAAVIAVPVLQERRRRVMDDTARGAAPGKFAELSQGVTHYQWHGPVRGPVAVCVHGLTTPSFVWRGLTPGLARLGFRVLTYDLYGRGFSDRPTGAQDDAFFLKQLSDLLAHENIDGDITLIGYSMGGAIATCFAAAHPARMRQLVLLAPAGMGLSAGKLVSFIARTPVVGDWLMLALYPHQLRKGVRAERGQATNPPDMGKLQLNELRYRRFVPSVLASLRGVLSDPLAAQHRNIHRNSIPVLAIWGRDDTVIPLTCVGTLAEWSRDAHQHVVDGAGHGLPYTHSDAVLDILQERILERP